MNISYLANRKKNIKLRILFEGEYVISKVRRIEKPTTLPSHSKEKKIERGRNEGNSHFLPFFFSHFQPNIIFFRYISVLLLVSSLLAAAAFFSFLFSSTRHSISFFFLLQFIFGDWERLTVFVKCECEFPYIQIELSFIYIRMYVA